MGASQIAFQTRYLTRPKVIFFVFAFLLAVVISGCANNSQKSSSTTTNSVKQQTERIGVIVGTDVNMRKGPGKNYESVGTFAEGEKVRILEPKDDFTEVERENKQRVWVSNWYFAELVYGKDKNVPEAVLYQPDPAFCGYDICPKKDLTVRATWKNDAPEIGKIKAEERAEVLEFKAVVYPKGTIKYKDKDIYVLTPATGVFFMYYVDGTVKFLRFPGHGKGAGYQDADKFAPGWRQAFELTSDGGKGHAYWCRVKGKDADGWFGNKEYDTVPFYQEKGSGIFLSRSNR